ncbi:MAG TPA: DUF1028 domain-containing protein [Candidatus Limnocylindrales bacterium]|nr:DUF1028 domain-containing protein [Candidatus Limnocylindrales bacterium]
MTYSIVARDPDSGRFGVAIQTCWPFVGAGCAWVESGVGAVVTQSFTEVAHGPNGLDLLRADRTAEEALSTLLARDAGREVRQVGIVDAAGRAAAHTGNRCVAAAGHAAAAGVSAQANMMERPTVWPAMIAAWNASAATFPERLIAALRAAEGEGGDIRGGQSAVVVVSGPPGAPAWQRDIDLRVDDHPAPLDELERLLRLHLGYEALDRAERLGAAGDAAGASDATAEARRLAPGDAQVAVWTAIGLAGVGRVDEARRLMNDATASNPRWPEFLVRFAESGAQPELVEPTRRLLDAIRTGERRTGERRPPPDRRQ